MLLSVTVSCKKIWSRQMDFRPIELDVHLHVLDKMCTVLNWAFSTVSAHCRLAWTRNARHVFTAHRAALVQPDKIRRSFFRNRN